MIKNALPSRGSRNDLFIRKLILKSALPGKSSNANSNGKGHPRSLCDQGADTFATKRAPTIVFSTKQAPTITFATKQAPMNTFATKRAPTITFATKEAPTIIFVTKQALTITFATKQAPTITFATKRVLLLLPKKLPRLFF